MNIEMHDRGTQRLTADIATTPFDAFIAAERRRCRHVWTYPRNASEAYCPLCEATRYEPDPPDEYDVAEDRKAVAMLEGRA